MRVSHTFLCIREDVFLRYEKNFFITNTRIFVDSFLFLSIVTIRNVEDVYSGIRLDVKGRVVPNELVDGEEVDLHAGHLLRNDYVP